MTYNNIIMKFRDIAYDHEQIMDFNTGQEWDDNGNPKPGLKYPALFAAGISMTIQKNTRLFRVRVLCMAQLSKDFSNREEILSDTASILSDVIKIFENESDFDLKEEPVCEMFMEQFADWCAGWRTELLIETDLYNSYCDIPKKNFKISDKPGFLPFGVHGGFVRDGSTNEKGYFVFTTNPGVVISDGKVCDLVFNATGNTAMISSASTIKVYAVNSDASTLLPDLSFSIEVESGHIVCVTTLPFIPIGTYEFKYVISE
jgi:hypothetical protein